MTRRSTVFVGSSIESLPVAQGVQVALNDFADVTVWTQGVFSPGQTYLQALVESADRFDFALLVLGPDDIVRSRDNDALAPRDNVIFELGFFIGALGRSRTFFLYNRDHRPNFRWIFRELRH